MLSHVRSLHRNLPTLRHLATLPGLALCVLLWSLNASAQQPLPAPSNSAPAALPDQTPGAIQGIVTDPAGDTIVGAQVTLTSDALQDPRQTVTDEEGCFHFANVPPGRFTISATSQGFAAAHISGDLSPGQQTELPDIALPIATAHIDAQVTLTLHDRAEEEMEDQETQRVIGLIPNFYVTYNWDAAPMSTAQKYKLAWRNLYDPINFVQTAGIAGIQQAENAIPGYGPGARGYAKRFGTDFQDFAFGSMLGGAVLPSLLHQDPRYIYKGTGTIRSRVAYALAAAFICKGDNGTWQPNYSSVLGDLGAGAISNLYYPYPVHDGNRVAGTIENGFLDVADDAIGNLIQEFLIRHLTRHPPTYPATAPAAFRDVFKPFSWK